MTELNSEDFENAGRNDPCPCGSGKKFKKCHQRKIRLQKEAEKKSRGVADLVNTHTTPYEIVKLLKQVRENNMAGLLWDFGHDEGPFRESYPNLESFIEACDSGDAWMPAAQDFEFRRIRIDGPDARLLFNRGLKDPKQQVVDIEVVTIRHNSIDASRAFREVDAPGWRIWNIEKFSRPKSELEDHDLRFDDLDYAWSEAWDAPAEFVELTAPEQEAESA